MPRINADLIRMSVYASKAISAAAKKDSSTINLSIGEPVFGPPSFLLDEIKEQVLTLPSLLDGCKRYQVSRGSLELRKAISGWYKRRYDIAVDPENEIIITHGGAEALALSILCTTNPGESVAVMDPSYMLYQRAVTCLARSVVNLPRPPSEDEYANICGSPPAQALIINSPENPTGYVLSNNDWNAVVRYAEAFDSWVIHDEVYDCMDFGRPHRPARGIAGLGQRSVLVNSFSKKFGVPGLRIGWIVASPELIEQASKAHDYLYLGVNILFERIAEKMLSDARVERWLLENRRMLSEKAEQARGALGENGVFRWPRKPYGAMFLFPEVSALKQKYGLTSSTTGEAVAEYLKSKCGIAVVPGTVYGHSGDNHIRLVLCGNDQALQNGIELLKRL